MTSTTPSPVSAVRRFIILVMSLGVTVLAVVAPITATWAATGTTPDGTVTPGQCQASSVVEQYPNGQIPLPMLCPLRGTTGESLRADAAYNFNRLSKAYAKQFGTPICVTDSYRSLPEQISLYRAKPKLAAVPGTSNHGWGVAADLCGGIETFTSVQHAWMFQNAPTYRWVHPAWAQETGSRPEPWHWEYAPRSDMVRDALGLPRLAGGYNGFQIGRIKSPVTQPPVKASVTASAYMPGDDV